MLPYFHDSRVMARQGPDDTVEACRPAGMVSMVSTLLAPAPRACTMFDERCCRSGPVDRTSVLCKILMPPESRRGIEKCRRHREGRQVVCPDLRFKDHDQNGEMPVMPCSPPKAVMLAAPSAHGRGWKWCPQPLSAGRDRRQP